jgi:hypothetical protein
MQSGLTRKHPKAAVRLRVLTVSIGSKHEWLLSSTGITRLHQFVGFRCDNHIRCTTSAVRGASVHRRREPSASGPYLTC